MSRVITARLTDEQYDWLVDEAVHLHDGDFSKALRAAIEQARSLSRLLNTPDPPARLAEMIQLGKDIEAEEIAREEGAR